VGGAIVPEVDGTSTSDRLDLLDLAAKYAYLSDAADLAGVMALFTENAVFDARSIGGAVASGAAQIRDHFTSAKRPINHHLTGAWLSAGDGNSATAHVRLLLLYRTRAVTVDYAWRLARRGEPRVAYC
jgi:ketosteroid isomerase-like protein